MNVILVGCGKLGSLLLKSWVESNSFNSLMVIEPNSKSLPAYPNVALLQKIEDLPDDFIPDVIVIAVKPQLISEVLPQYAHYSSAVFVSLAASINLIALKRYLGQDASIVRIMPNIAIKVGYSVNLAFFPDNHESVTYDMVSKLFLSTGELIALDKEEWIETLTVISGSGPAYFFFLAQLMLNYAVEHSIPKALAYRIIQQTLFGSGLMGLHEEDLDSFSKLQETVGGKNSITEVALAALTKDLPEIFKSAINLASQKSRDLSNENSH